MINLKETKRLKNALAERPQEFRSIIEDTPLAICITNEDAMFVAMNQNYLDLYGFTREQLEGNSFTLVVPEENRAALKRYHDQFFVDRYEILRKWVVQRSDGKSMEIFADAGFNDRIQGRPHKVTFVQFLRVVDSGQEAGSDTGNKMLGSK